MLLAFKPLLHNPFLWKERKINSFIAMIVLRLHKALKQPKENKSKEAVETNKDIGQLLLSIQKAFDVLVEKSTDLPIPAIRGDTRSPASLRWRQVCW